MPKAVTRSWGDRWHSLIVRLYHARPRWLSLDQPIISFCFDDFPQSAADAGADILARSGHRGTFYLSTALDGYEDQAGRYADFATVRRLIAAGHDIGCHTHDHIDLLHSTRRSLKADLEHYRRRSSEELGEHRPRTFSYPYGLTNLRNKHYLAGKFDLVRGIRAGINRDLTDLAHLKANELAGPETIERALALIEENSRAKGFLIFFTHDVDPSPSNHGCQPHDLEKVMTAAVASGARIVTMAEAADMLVRRRQTGNGATIGLDAMPERHRSPPSKRAAAIAGGDAG